MGWGKYLAAAVAAATILMTNGAEACEAGDGKELCKTKSGHYRILLPSGAGPHPTVVYLYGSTGQSEDLVSAYSPLQLLVQRGYAVIVPAALDVFYNDRKFKVQGEDSGWHLRNERRKNKRNETAFLKEVLADAEVRHRINRQRVLLTGHSRGAMLTWEIACHAPELANAYAPVAGLYFGKMPRTCERPVRLQHTHGRADTVVPLKPSERTKGSTPLPDSLDRIGTAANCTHPGTKNRLKEYDRSIWWGCQSGASVELLLHDGGHAAPLSWYTAVLDWFEKGTQSAPQTVQGGTARFQGTSTAGQSGSLLRKGTARDNSRFKKAKVPTN
jgi:polyhydroxybutyrate depolymerase